MDGESVVETLAASSLVEYLIRVCPLILDVEESVFQSSLSVTINKRILEDFITDPRNSVLVVKKVTHETEGMIYH